MPFRSHFKQSSQEQERTGSWSLLDRLIDSQLEWRQVICEANGGEQALASLQSLQIKRQEVIHELVQTERHHCLTLALMRQVYLNGLRRLNEARCQQHNSSIAAGSNKPAQQQPTSGTEQPPNELIDLERLFPALEDLIQAHELFFAHLRLLLVESCNPSNATGADQRPLLGFVGRLGELLYEQFRISNSLQPAGSQEGRGPQPEAGQAGEPSRAAKGNGYKLLAAYGKFCGQHNDSSRYYKHLVQNDKAFKHFIEQCNKLHPSCRQRGIPECNLLVTQRLTKYPLLIDQLIKTSKDDPEEEHKLRLALAECKALLAELNSQLARKESFERLLGIYAQFCPKSYTIYNRHLKFTKHDLLQHKRLRQLIHSDGQVRVWSAQRRKLFQVLCLILNDIIVFLRVEAPSPSSQQQQQHQLLPVNFEHEHPESSAPTAGSLIQSALDFVPQLDNSEPVQHQQQSISHNVLINVVANALQTGHQGGVAQTQATTGSGFSVRYYFANIDQKSSVISLSKLLIREKAANDGDGPRIYLISSSPRQPEMYELAFLSKRHQTSFVEKLKSCVEQHTRSLLEGDAEDVINDDEEERLFENACCKFHELSHRKRTSDSSEEEDEEEEEDGDREEEEEEEEDDDDDDDDDERFSNKTSPKTSTGYLRASSLKEKPDNCELDFELDIEEDVIIPSQEQEASENFSGQLGEGQKATERLAYLGSTLTVVDNQQAQGEPDNQTDADFGEQTDSNELISNESGLSERARDSLDESSSLGKRARVNQRRRRANRPRNVSNQSSSSSEAAHRQAIHIIQSGSTTSAVTPQPALKSKPEDYVEEDFDSGRGHDDSSSSAASISSSSLEPEKEADREKESPTGSATALTTSNSKSSHKVESPPSETPAKSLSSASSTTSSRSSSKLSPCKNAESGSATVAGQQQIRTSNLVKCSSVLSKSACSVKQQRKLSTVSTMSSQLKLLSKFKSSASSSSQQNSNGTQQQQHYFQYPLAIGCNQCDTAASSSSPSGSGSLIFSKQARQHLRRSTFIPEQKLEELRDLRIQLDKDKQEWQSKFDRMQEQLLNERRELDLAREKLKQEKQQVANERDQLYRKLDVLKEKGILLSPSHKVIITSPDAAAAMMYQQQQNHHHHHHHQYISECNPPQQQIHLINAGNYQRQPIQAGYNSTSSIRINQPQQPHSQHLQTLVTNDGRQATNLFIQNPAPTANAAKVPLHLSEQRGHTGNRGVNSISTTQRVTSSLGLNKFPPLMQVFGGGIGLMGSPTEPAKQLNHHLESHLI